MTLFAPTTLCQAMLLAAGRGSRLRPLTDSTPKPLVEVGQRPLLQWHLEALARQPNIHRVCINTAWLGADIQDYFASYFQLEDFLPEGADAATVTAADNRKIDLTYSEEGSTFGRALETAGGICHALPQLADAFWLAAGDALMPDFAFAQADYDAFAASDALAQLWLVPNPDFKRHGDFGIDSMGRATLPSVVENAAEGVIDSVSGSASEQTYTYSTIGLFKKTLFQSPWCAIADGNPNGTTLRLVEVLRPAITAGRVTATLYTGYWEDVGTSERLASAREHMRVWQPTSRLC